MISFNEVPIAISSRKKPLFIDYSQINSDSKKRILFLRALIKIVNLQQSIIHYDELGLKPDDVDPFKQYLNEKYPELCRLHKKTLNMDDFEGKVILNIDLLIDDIFKLLSQDQIEEKLTKKVIEECDSNSLKDENSQIFVDKTDEKTIGFSKPSNKFLIEIFDTGISLAETQVFVNKVLKETKSEDIEEIFNFSSLSREISKIPLKIKNEETDFENEVLFKEILLKILKKFSAQLPNKEYWEKISIDVDDYFSKILERCDQEKLTLSFENGKKYEVTINEILLEDNIKIFQAIPGIPDERNHNSVISEYQKKKALFNFKCDLTEKIQPDNYVLSKIIAFADTYVIVNPLKILTNRETLKLLSLGIEGYPSAEENSLTNIRGKRMSESNNRNDLVNLIQRGRIEFLERSIKKSAERKDYSKIIQYFSSPTLQLAIQDRVKIDEYSSIDVQGLSNENLRKQLITALFNYYREDPKNFEKFFSDGQYIIWQTVFLCAENLVKIKDDIESIGYSAKKGNYPNSCEVVKEYLSHLADAYRQITILEKKLGVDRYLATSGLTKDIKILHDLVGEIRSVCNKKLELTVIDFQLNWNIASVSKSIEKMLGEEIQDNSITNSINNNQENVIFLLLDGFGYTQYLWYSRGIRERKSTTFSLNIFEWLSEFDEFNDNRILSSTLITDTGSALATIFSGKQPSETHIYASKILHGLKTINVKKVTGKGFSSLVDKCPNTFLDQLLGVQTCIFDGGRKKSNYGEVSFSRLIYSDNAKIPVPISERIFKKILTSIDISKKQLNVAYFPLIDNTGHSIGAFTSFESYEYEKLNILFVEFLLNLAQTKKEIFNGKTTILISADHGMFETSIKKFTMNELKSYLSGKNLPIPLYSNNNRAVLFYHIADGNLENYRNVIQEFLKNKKIEAKILISTDELFSRLLSSTNPDCPSLLLLIQGDGFAMDFELEEEQLHHGGHGGCSCEEVFVPFITLSLTPNLHRHLIEHFAKIS